ncbi:MAG: DUF2017 family protein [Acidimicrobiales bacterium]
MNRLRPIRRNRDGRYELRLGRVERQLLQSLPGQLEPILASGSDELRRLYPPAYRDDPGRQAEYEQLMQADLTERHRQSLSVLADTAGSRYLTEDELATWLRAINSLRLVMGTRLGVTEDVASTRMHKSNDPERAQMAIYHYLSYLQEQAVAALSGSVPE